jgi:ABC-type antimicrobial peptide transport system permease subunit
VVVSERLAMSLFGRSDVVGRTIKSFHTGSRPEAYTVVGVVGDVHWARIEDGYAPILYLPLQRDGDGLPPDSNAVRYRPMDVQYAIRGTQLPDAATIREVVKQLDHRVPVTRVRPLGALVDAATARVRLTLVLIATAGVAALLLGVIGVYSVVSYAANGRIREFGIRLALGAAPSRVGGMVLSDGLRLVAIGTAVGLVAALTATRFLRALMYELNPTSFGEFGMATALMIMVTVVATLLPARRAARTHPASVLRGE